MKPPSPQRQVQYPLWMYTRMPSLEESDLETISDLRRQHLSSVVWVRLPVLGPPRWVFIPLSKRRRRTGPEDDRG